MSEPPTVVVTGLGGGGLGEQVLKALRLSAIRYRVVGCDVTRISKGLQEVDRSYILPPATDPDYVDCLLAVCRTEGARALFPGSEAELRVLSRGRRRVENAGVFCPMNPADVIDVCLDKRRTMERIRHLGFSCPRTVWAGGPGDLDAVDFLPAILKPSVGGGGSSDVHLAQTKAELRAIADGLLAARQGILVQEYVGTPEEEYTVGVLIAMDGELLHSIGMRRSILPALSNRLKVPNRTGRAELGPVLAISNGISQGEVGMFPEVTGRCESLALALGCRGATNFQCRRVAGEPCFFEINPRFSGTTSARALFGFNEPDLLVRRHVLGEPIAPRFAYESGHLVRGLAEVRVDDRPVPQARGMR